MALMWLPKTYKIEHASGCACDRSYQANARVVANYMGKVYRQRFEVYGQGHHLVYALQWTIHALGDNFDAEMVVTGCGGFRVPDCVPPASTICVPSNYFDGYGIFSPSTLLDDLASAPTQGWTTYYFNGERISP